MHEVLNGKKGIFFDVGFTLDKPASGDWMITKKAYEVLSEYKIDLRQNVIAQAMEKAMVFLEANHLVKGFDEEYEQFKRFYAIINDEGGLNLPRSVTDELAYDRTFNMENYIFYDDVAEVLTALHGKYKLGVISDTWPSITSQLQKAGITELFSSLTFSCDLGTFKPDSRMYHHALSHIGLDPEETVFIDDSVRNLAGAAKLGITPILIAANKASDVETEYTKIYSLSELLG